MGDLEGRNRLTTGEDTIREVFLNAVNSMAMVDALRQRIVKQGKFVPVHPSRGRRGELRHPLSTRDGPDEAAPGLLWILALHWFAYLHEMGCIGPGVGLMRLIGEQPQRFPPPRQGQQLRKEDAALVAEVCRILRADVRISPPLPFFAFHREQDGALHIGESEVTAFDRHGFQVARLAISSFTHQYLIHHGVSRSRRERAEARLNKALRGLSDLVTEVDREPTGDRLLLLLDQLLAQERPWVRVDDRRQILAQLLELFGAKRPSKDSAGAHTVEVRLRAFKARLKRRIAEAAKGNLVPE